MLKNRLYAFGQSALFCAFAAVYFLTHGSPLFRWQHAQVVADVFCFVGLACILVSIRSLRGVVQVSPEPRAAGHLVTSGLYRWMRHPIYTGVVIALIGLFLKKPTAIVGGTTLAIIVFLWLKSHYEERLLSAAYENYGAYRTTSWGLFPGFRG